MNIVTVYGMMQKLSKKFKDTTGLIKSLASDYLMATSDVGRKILFGPVSSASRMVRLPAENNMTAGTEVLTILNTDATSNALLFSNDMSKLLCAVKPGGAASIGFASAGAYSIYQKSLLDSWGFYERFYNNTVATGLEVLAGNVRTIILSANVIVKVSSATIMCVKWDATNGVFRYSNGVVPQQLGAWPNGMGGVGTDVKLVPLGPTAFAAGSVCISNQGWGSSSGLSMTTYSVTVGADGVAPIITQTHVQTLGHWIWYEDPYYFQFSPGIGITVNHNNIWEMYSINSTSFALSFNYTNTYNVPQGNMVYRFSFSGGTSTVTHSNAQAALTGYKVSVIGFDNSYLGLVYLESSKLRGQIWQLGGTVGALVDISANNVAHAAVTLGLSSTTGVVTYLNSNSPSVYKQNIVTRSGTTFVPNTAYTMPFVTTDLRFESATSYVVNGQGLFTFPLSGAYLTTHSVYDVSGGVTPVLRSEYKLGTFQGCRPTSGRVVMNLLPGDVSGTPKKYWTVYDTSVSRYGTANGNQYKQLTETGGIISAETDGTGFGGYVQAT